MAHALVDKPYEVLGTSNCHLRANITVRLLHSYVRMYVCSYILNKLPATYIIPLDYSTVL